MPVAVGIDLGTTYSCVAALIHGKVEVIASSDYGHRTTPSCVAFVDGEEQELVGEAALTQAARNPSNTVYDVKRLIGRKHNEQSVQDDVRRWPFKVSNAAGDPVINVTHNGDPKMFCPQQISAMVLRKLKASAEDLLGHAVTEAVITVPAYFTDSQRRATREAGELAGLRVLRLIPEPTAAALAYGLERRIAVDKQVLIYDLGGGTFDVSVVTTSGGHLVVGAVGGNSHLGGTDFDQLVVKYAAEEVRRKLGHDVTGNAGKMRRLLTKCERAKRDLSAVTRSAIDVEDLVHEEFLLPLTRAKFEELCKDLLTSTIDVVKGVLSVAKMTAADIDEVILVGGSTRMPCVERLLAEVFPGKPIGKTTNPDEAVAYGAALWAAHLSNDDTAFLRGLDVQNVTPLTVGVEGSGGVFGAVIPRNTAIPVRKERGFQTAFNDQRAVTFPVYQGERLVTKHNKLIGTFLLKDLPPAPAGLLLDAALCIDEDGILSVEAKVRTSKEWQGCTLQLDDRTTSDIVSNLEDAERYREEDEREVERLKKKRKLETFLWNNVGRASEKAKAAFTETQHWFDKNPDASIDEITSKLTALTEAANIE